MPAGCAPKSLLECERDYMTQRKSLGPCCMVRENCAVGRHGPSCFYRTFREEVGEGVGEEEGGLHAELHAELCISEIDATPRP